MFNRNIFQRLLLWGAAVFSSMTLMGCAQMIQEAMSTVSLTPEKTAQYQKAPQIYDIYVMKCSDLVDGIGTSEYPYCLAQIGAIAPDKMVFFYSDLQWDTAENAVEALRKTNLNAQANVYFYRHNPLLMSSASVEKLYAQKKIFAIRRLSESEVAEFVTQVQRRPY